VVASIAHGDGVGGHLRLVVRGGDDGVVETRAPAALGGVDAGGAADAELGGGGIDLFDCRNGINTLAWDC
jgi:hypothetical protein